jgi:hypothetical protein
LREAPKKEIPEAEEQVELTEEQQAEQDEEKKFKNVLKAAFKDFVSNKRIWMGCASNYVYLTTYFCLNLYGSVIYRTEER